MGSPARRKGSPPVTTVIYLSAAVKRPRGLLKKQNTISGLGEDGLGHQTPIILHPRDHHPL